MEKDAQLYPEEILCLQLMGLKSSVILNADVDYFDSLYEQTPEMDRFLDKAESLLQRQSSAGVTSLTHHDSRFPDSLRAIGDDCPPMVYRLGTTDLIHRENLTAIIGARQCDRRGFDVAYRLGCDYAKRNHVVVSGLALGCDTAAHTGCLDARGETIAIVGSGLDITHPHESKPLQTRILIDVGLLLSEQPFVLKYKPSRLVARNRLQAALSQTVIVAQCPESSGTMHTVRFAQKYDKCLLAAPYHVYTEKSSGNRLLLSQSLAVPAFRLSERRD